MSVIIPYSKIVSIEKQSLQRGMNFRCNPEYSILLMSTRNNAPFEDEIVADGRVLIYEGHNAYKNHTDKDLNWYFDGVFNHCGRGFWAFHHLLETFHSSYAIILAITL